MYSFKEIAKFKTLNRLKAYCDTVGKKVYGSGVHYPYRNTAFCRRLALTNPKFANQTT
jgi:hypothetical protein